VNGLLIQSILHGFHPHRSVRNVRGEIFHVGAGGVSLKNALEKNLAGARKFEESFPPFLQK
jgi:hypothetical protein